MIVLSFDAMTSIDLSLGGRSTRQVSGFLKGCGSSLRRFGHERRSLGSLWMVSILQYNEFLVVRGAGGVEGEKSWEEALELVREPVEVSEPSSRSLSSRSELARGVSASEPSVSSKGDKRK